MLSRAAILSAQQCRGAFGVAIRATATTPATNSAAAASTTPQVSLVRQEPGKVRMGFVPDEWFQMFYKKTGVTGPYTFGATLATYLVSKEFYVLEHEYYTGISLLIICIVAVKKLGPPLAQYLDKEIDNYETDAKAVRGDEKNGLENQIKHEEHLQWSMEGQKMLVDAKRENVHLQLEATYRSRLLTAFEEVKKRLDYQVEKQNIERRITQKNLVDWVLKRVHASITPDQEKQNIDKCIADLSLLAKA